MNNINIIYLMLGSSCNFNCRYCLQTDNLISNQVLSKEVIDYLWSLIYSCNISKEKLKLMFWGGEPLLYINIIKQVIGIFGDKFNYSIVTNGALLTQEIVNYINQNNISVALSYDGEQTINTRKVDILQNDKIKTLFLQINNKAINSVVSAYNYDFEKLYSYIENINNNITVNIESLKVTWNMPKDIYDINYQDFQDKLHIMAINTIKDILEQKLTNRVNFFLPYLNKVCNNTKSNIPLACCQMYKVLNIDLKGNIYSCHNLNTPIGTIKDDYNELITRQNKWVEENLSPKCKQCEYFDLCKGSCPCDKLNENQEKYSCEYYKILFKEVMYIVDELNNVLKGS